MRSLNLLIRFGIRRKCLRIGRSQSLYLSLRKVMKQIVVIFKSIHLGSITYKHLFKTLL